MSIKDGNLRAIAYHLEQGHDNGDITRGALALFLRGVAAEMERLTAELNECQQAAFDNGRAVGARTAEYGELEY